jgi:hypothetical protein
MMTKEETKEMLRKKLAIMKCHINNGLEFKSNHRFFNWFNGKEDGGVQAWFDQLHRMHNEIADLSMDVNYEFMGQLPFKQSPKVIEEQMKMKEKQK